MKIKLKGITIEADLSEASFVLGEPIGKNINAGGLNINIADETKQYDVMGP